VSYRHTLGIIFLQPQSTRRQFSRAALQHKIYIYVYIHILPYFVTDNFIMLSVWRPHFSITHCKSWLACLLHCNRGCTSAFSTIPPHLTKIGRRREPSIMSLSRPRMSTLEKCLMACWSLMIVYFFQSGSCFHV